MERIDKSMRKDILNFPKQFKVGLEAAKNIKIKKKVRKYCCFWNGRKRMANRYFNHLA